MSTLSERYNVIVDALAEMVFLFDRDGLCLDFINPPNYITLISPETIVSKNVAEVMPEPVAGEIMSYIEKVLLTHRVHHHSYQLIVNDELRTYEARYVPSGRDNILALIRDITERKKVEAELVKSREELRQLSNYIENIREEERLNIAREIHDELGQQLMVLKLTVSRIGKKMTAADDVFSPDIKELLGSIDIMVETVRKISAALRPGILDDLGLVAALEWYSDDFGKTTGIKTSFIADIRDDDIIPEKLAVNIFRIFQESLTNVARHSEASKLDISLMIQEEQLVMLIEDNGKGFDSSTVESKKPLGLLGMRERAIMLEGTYTIYSNPGEGTVTAVVAPLPAMR